MGAGAEVASIVAAFVVAMLAAWLAARQVARQCMRAEHRLLAGRVERVEVAVAVRGERDDDHFTDMARRLDRLEHHLGFWSPPPTT